jgi:hypothetical protein
VAEDVGYDDYEEELVFKSDFKGEPIITRVLIYSDGNIQLLQGPKTGEGEFRPDDIVGMDRDELQEILEKADEVRGEER